MTLGIRDESAFYRATRRVLPHSFRARLTLFALFAAATPLLIVAAAWLALGPAPDVALPVFAIAAIPLAFGVMAVRALAAPVEALGAELGAQARSKTEADSRDAVGRIALGVAELCARLDLATQRGDPARLDDPLTGLPNRLAAMRRGRDEITRARRSGDPLSVALVAFRDDSGAGGEKLDVALRYAAEALTQTLRAYDVVARWDGPRFAVVLPEAEVEHAVAALGRVAEDLEPALRQRGYSEGFALVAGVAVLQPEDATLADIAQRAESALDRARGGFGPAIAAAPGPRSRPAHLSSV